MYVFAMWQASIDHFFSFIVITRALSFHCVDNLHTWHYGMKCCMIHCTSKVSRKHLSQSRVTPLHFPSHFWRRSDAILKILSSFLHLPQTQRCYPTRIYLINEDQQTALTRKHNTASQIKFRSGTTSTSHLTESKFKGDLKEIIVLMQTANKTPETKSVAWIKIAIQVLCD